MLPAGHASTAGSPIPRHTAALHGYLQHTITITSSNNGALTPQWHREISVIKPTKSKIEKPQNELEGKKKKKMENAFYHKNEILSIKNMFTSHLPSQP